MNALYTRGATICMPHVLSIRGATTCIPHVLWFLLCMHAIIEYFINKTSVSDPFSCFCIQKFWILKLLFVFIIWKRHLPVEIFFLAHVTFTVNLLLICFALSFSPS
ncbi:hypothetical protein ACJX0J_030659 [Zea mays]